MNLQRKLANCFSSYLINKAKKTPYTHISSYMSRWWLIPYLSEIRIQFSDNPLGWLIQKCGIAIRIHEIKKSDDARAHHNHPFYYCSVILHGGYFEYVHQYNKSGLWIGERVRWHGPGSIIFHKPSWQHRLVIPEGKPATTLFITTQKIRQWGFIKDPKIITPHQEYIHHDIQNQ